MVAFALLPESKVYAMHASVKLPRNLSVGPIQSLQLAHATEFFILKNMLGHDGRELGSTIFDAFLCGFLCGDGSTWIIFVKSIFIVKN